MAEGPRILAGFVQSSLEAIDELDQAMGAAARQRLKPETLEAIEGASPIGWIAIEIDVELTEAFFAVAGAERACQAFRQNLVRGFDRPLLRPIAEGATAILGRSPHRLLRWAPKVWSLVFRDCGSMTLDATPNGALLRLTDLPLAITASQDYLEGVGATIEGVFFLAGVPGRCELLRIRGKEAEFVLSWKLPS
jgi:hypothetical protein